MLPENKSETPLVSIITVNYNNAGVTSELLASLRSISYPSLEVIVVDNGSDENPTAALAKEMPAAKIILSKENLGFSGGNNLGINAATGEFLFLVNNDTEFTEGLIEGLLEIFRQYPDAGMASPKIHYFFHKGTIQYAGYNAVDGFTGRNTMVGSREIDRGQYDAVAETSYAHGAAMMISRKALEKVGLMPEIYFLYYEELDWSEQFKRQGFKIYYQYKSLIYHKESMTTGKNSPMKTYYITRNRLLFMRRNVNTPTRIIFMCYFTFFAIPKNTLRYIMKRETAHLKAFWQGIFWNIGKSGSAALYSA